ncbi:hypothetical protein BH11ACT5_BH11ACT5_06750 [soil metagenome]
MLLRARATALVAATLVLVGGPLVPASAANDDSPAVFVGGNFVIDSDAAEAEGRTVIRGDLVVGDLTRGDHAGAYGFGAVGGGSQNHPAAGEATVVVGGAVRVETPHSVIVAPGYLAYGTTLTGTVSSDSRLEPAAITAYAAMPERIRSLSACAAALSPNGTVTRNTSFQNEFVGTGAAVQVFSVSGLPEQGIPIGFSHLADNATVVVNVMGTDPVIDSTSLTPGNLGQRLLWNFPEARTVHIQGPMQFFGTVLVPSDARVTTVDVSGANGQIWVNGDLVHGGVNLDALGNDGLGDELHNYPFLGSVPCGAPPAVTVPPEPLTETSTEPELPTQTEVPVVVEPPAVPTVVVPPTVPVVVAPPTVPVVVQPPTVPTVVVPPTVPPVVVPPTVPVPASTPPAGPELAHTGTSPVPAVAAAAVSILVGLALLFVVPRPRRRH